jgi:hypothetical protein
MPYQVDAWGGDLHQRHHSTELCDTWAEASALMEPLIDAGMLCNVMHTDFKAPPERVAEMGKALKKQL